MRTHVWFGAKLLLLRQPLINLLENSIGFLPQGSCQRLKAQLLS